MTTSVTHSGKQSSVIITIKKMETLTEESITPIQLTKIKSTQQKSTINTLDDPFDLRKENPLSEMINCPRCQGGGVIRKE